MAMSAMVWETVLRYAARFAPPVSAAAPFGPTTPADAIQAHEDECRDWTRRLAEQLAHTHGVVWGTKRASLTRPVSKDTVCTQVPFVGYDILRASGTGVPELAVYPPLESALDGQVFVPVFARDHLNTSPDPPIPPDDDPADGCDLAADLSTIKAELAAANDQQQLIVEELARMIQSLDTLPARVAVELRRGDPVPVKLKW